MFDSHFSSGLGLILLTNVQCTGKESKLLECGCHFCDLSDCTHGNDVGVICERMYNVLYCIILYRSLYK